MLIEYDLEANEVTDNISAAELAESKDFTKNGAYLAEFLYEVFCVQGLNCGFNWEEGFEKVILGNELDFVYNLSYILYASVRNSKNEKLKKAVNKFIRKLDTLIDE